MDPSPLPAHVRRLLDDLDAPPRLGAHLRLVHDVAAALVTALASAYPQLVFDHEAVLFGAATHDIGKTVHSDELSGPGSAHEQAGYDLLVARGIPATLARFARTHADWHAPGVTIEDLLVSLADKIWKAKRVPDLEDLVVRHLAAAGDVSAWQAFMALDDILNRLAAPADARLEYQNRYPVLAG